MATGQHALSGHMTLQSPWGTSPRVRAAPRLRGAEGRGAAASAAAGPVRAEAQPPPPSRSWDPWFLAGGRREPCRSGSGAASCALTAAGRVSRAGWARSPQLSRPGPLSRGRLLGSGGSRRSSPELRARGRDEEEPGRPWGGPHSGPDRDRRAGAAALQSLRPSFPSCSLCPRPDEEAAGSGPLPQQEGAWAIHRKAVYRSKM